MTSKLALALTTFAPALAFGLAAEAGAAGVAFRYNDLDLGTEAGRAELEKRIDSAMRAACPDETITGSRITVSGARAECMAEVRRQINARMASRPASGSSSR